MDTILVWDAYQDTFHPKCIGVQSLHADDEWLCQLYQNDKDIVMAGDTSKADKKRDRGGGRGTQV